MGVGGNGNLIPIKKGERLNPNGRPPKLLSSLMIELKSKGYEQVKPVHVLEAYELMLGLSEDEVTRLVNDIEQPMIVRVVGKAYLGRRGFQVLEEILNRVHGRSQQSLDVTSNGKRISFTEEELLEAIKPNDTKDK